MIKPDKIIVIGGNAAGPAAAAKAKRTNPDAEVILFEAGNFISTGTCEIPYVLSGEIKCYQKLIAYDPETFEKEKHVKVFINHLAEEILPREKKILIKKLEDNSTAFYDYDKLILTTGSKTKKLPNISASADNVFFLKTIYDLDLLQNFITANKPQHAVIIGSGYIGIEAAEALTKSGIEVSILEKEVLPLPYTEIEVRHLILEQLKRNNILFYGNAKNYKVVEEKNNIKFINIESRLIKADLVLICIGFSPNTELAQKAKLEIGKYGGIKVDKKLRTSDPNIYAAGDNIEVVNALTNKHQYIPLATYAHSYGHTAGENAAGGNNFIQPVIKNIAVKVFDKFNVEVGITSEEAAANHIYFDSVSAVVPNLVEVMPQSSKVFGKIIYRKDNHQILGAAFLGGKEASGYGDIISLMIKAKLPADLLTEIDYNYTPPLSPFINLLSVLGRKVK